MEENQKLVQKGLIRNKYKEIRTSLSRERKKLAERAIFEILVTALEPYSCVLSYYSFSDELSMKKINRHLSSTGRLSLPKIQEHSIEVYLVHDIEKELQKNSHPFLEPNPNLCKKTEAFDCCIVPAIAFDKNYHRVGFGKGYYDRLIEKYPHVLYIGVGYEEQLVLGSIQREEHDRCVTKLYLV